MKTATNVLERIEHLCRVAMDVQIAAEQREPWPPDKAWHIAVDDLRSGADLLDGMAGDGTAIQPDESGSVWRLEAIAHFAKALSLETDEMERHVDNAPGRFADWIWALTTACSKLRAISHLAKRGAAERENEAASDVMVLIADLKDFAEGLKLEEAPE